MLDIVLVSKRSDVVYIAGFLVATHRARPRDCLLWHGCAYHPLGLIDTYNRLVIYSSYWLRSTLYMWRPLPPIMRHKLLIRLRN